MKSFYKDLPASLVVFLVALPLCLGIALASGAPLFSGIIAGIVGGVVVGALSGSHTSVSGPAAGLTVVVLDAIQSLGSFEVFLTAVVLAGAIQFVFGVVKAGVVGHYFPSSVIKGMLSAIGLILILKQIPHALGYDEDYIGNQAFWQPDQENTFSEIVNAVAHFDTGALIVFLVSLLILIICEHKKIKKLRLLQFFPPALFAVLAGVVINYLFGVYLAAFTLSGVHLVQIPVAHSLNQFIGQFSLPDFHAVFNFDIYPVAFTLAIIASLESLLSIEAADKIDPLRRITPPSRELRAQGIGNMLSGLIGGLPITAVIVRSSANVSSGAVSRNSAILHGLWLALAVIIIPTWLNLIPLSCLAAVLILVGYKLIKPSIFREVMAKGKDQFIPFIVTIVAILFTDLLVGIGVGMLVGLFFVIKSNFKSAIRFTTHNNNYLIRLHKDVSFLNKSILIKFLEKVPNGGKLVIDANKASFIDADILELIENFTQTAKYKDISITLVGFEYQLKH